MASSVAAAQVNVTTEQNDIGRTSQNLNETILTPSNVNPSQFGKLFAQPVDGQIYAQPLYLSGLSINGATHNVVFVATENASVYAFDADTNGGANSQPIWYASMLSAAHGAASGAASVTATEVGNVDLSPVLGITGTPVIDPSAGTLYLVSTDYENGNAVQRLHALSVYTGAEEFGGPVVISGTVSGTGSGSANGSLTFDPLWENQRPGLLLLNGIVYIGYGSQSDNGPWHGWIFGYKAATLQQTGVYCSSPNGLGSGFWMSGAGLAADQVDPANHPYGRIFVSSGNGDYNASTPYNASMDYGDTDLDLDLTNGVPTVTDQFTTYNQASLDSQDLDVGSGGLLVLPTQTTGSYPNLAVQTGKSGTLFLLNRDNLGGYNTSDQVVQSISNAVGGTGAWSSPAYWNGTIYYWGRIDHLKAFPLINGMLSTTPTESSEQENYPGSTPSISANGSTQGIVWTIDSEDLNTGPSILEAHDASNVATTLYSSKTNSARDSAGAAVRFTVPTVANGKVYVGTGELDIYGLLSSNNVTPVPVFSSGSGSITGPTNVTITDATPNAAIYYTTNGKPSNTSATLYQGPITVSSTETIYAIASASGQDLSGQAMATYTSEAETQPVAFSLATGTYNALQVISLSDPTSNAIIYYTTDGSTPSNASSVYSTPITVHTTETISAIAVAPGFSASPVSAATYTIQEGQTGIEFTNGFASSAGLITLNGVSDLDDSRLQLTDGMTGEAGTAWFNTPVDIQTFTTTFSFQLSNAKGNGITFAIQKSPAGLKALGGSGDDLGYAPISNSVAIKFDLYHTATGQAANSTGLSVNGAVPGDPSIHVNPVNLHSGDAMSVTLVYNGSALSMTITDLVTAQVFSTNWTVNIPATIGSTMAFVGFTGSTSADTASQKVLTWTYVNNYPHPIGNLDKAIDASTGSTTVAATDNLFASGWIADPTDGSPLSNVKVLIDGVSAGTPRLGIPRPDVASHWNNPAYANSGFAFTYPANSLTQGQHAVTVVGVDSHSVSTTLGPMNITVAAP